MRTAYIDQRLASIIRRPQLQGIQIRHIQQFTRTTIGILVGSLALTISLALTVTPALGQQQPGTATSSHTGTATFADSATSLPSGPIGKDDLIGVAVYDSPELTRSVRVDTNGTIRLPMLQKHIQAVGLMPEDLEKSIRAALIEGQLMVDPIVTVTVLEYRSRPIYVVGAVRSPLTFQAAGTVTLLDAILKAGGLTDNAGPEITVSSQSNPSSNSQVLTKRIPTADLFAMTNTSSNIPLAGGELIRVSEAGHYYVMGNVKQPGEFTMKTGSEPTVLKALTLSGGLQPYPRKLGYIYRSDGDNGEKAEIPIELKAIIDHKSPDIAMKANDILYIPEATGKRNTANAARTIGLLGASLATTLIYIFR